RTPELVRDVADRHDPDIEVRYLRNTRNLGLTGNWNRCVRDATGEYIQLFHQDDLMAPGMLARLAAVLREERTVGFVHSAVRRIDARGEVRDVSFRPASAGRSPGSRFIEELLPGPIVCCPTVLIRRSVYDAVGLFDGRFKFAADQEMWFR